MNMNHYENIRELLPTLLTLKKLRTKYVIRHLHLYVPNKGTYMANQLPIRVRKYFNTIGKTIIGGGINKEAMGLENEDFSDED